MALTDGNGNDMVMPVAPLYGGGNGGFGNGFGGDWAWIILLLLLGWGNNGWGGFGGAGMGGFAADGAVLYPWMNQAQVTTDGFQNQLMNDNITSIRDGVQGISTQLCNGFGDVQMALANGFAGVEQGANTRQIANMQQAFAAQTATAQGFNNIQSQLANCCCENRLGTADLKYTIATENCADRYEAAQNTRDIIDSQTRGTQAILDKLCALELDGVKAQVAAEQRENANLRSELMYARGQASQIEQNAFISQGFANEVDALYNRLNSCPVPTTPVYGRTPIFTCNQNGGCNCGGNGFIN